jgi:adenylate cyclase
MGAEPVQRRLAAILAGDVAGYSRLMGVDEVATLAALRAHRTEAIDPKLARHNGRVVKTTGDGILIEFPSVVDAVRCAVAIQDDMRARNSGVAPEKRIEFRIGINVGDIIVEGGDVFGDGVNIAARLEQLAEPGGICISRAAYEQVRDKLAFKFEDCGQQAVKNIARPIRVYRFSIDGVKAPIPAASPKPRRRIVALVAAAAALIVAAAAAWLALPVFTSMGADRPPSLGTPRLSIAVLPFGNLSGDKDQDYFADALTEDLTADLSRISGSFVISRSTAATFKGHADAKRVARELNVRYLLEGNVRKAGSEVHVNVLLIDGTSGQQVWSERYAKSTGDMYTFQNEVTGRVARALNLELKDAVSRQAARGRPGNLEAEDYALRAWAELWTKPQTKGTNDAAFAFVEKALALDPHNAEAHGVAAYAHARAATYVGWSGSRPESIRLGILAGEKAVALDPKNADALYALAFLYSLEGDVTKSQDLLRQCMALNRNHAPAYFYYGQNLIRLNRARDTFPWIERAFALSPRDPLRSVWHGAMARARISVGDDALAIEAAKQGIGANRDHPHNYAVLAAASAHLGRLDEARAAIGDFRRVQPGITIARYRANLTSNTPQALEAYERLMSGLRKAGLPD